MVLEKQDSAKVCAKRGQITFWTQAPQTRHAFMCVYHQMACAHAFKRNFPSSKTLEIGPVVSPSCAWHIGCAAISPNLSSSLPSDPLNDAFLGHQEAFLELSTTVLRQASEACKRIAELETEVCIEF